MGLAGESIVSQVLVNPKLQKTETKLKLRRALHSQRKRQWNRQSRGPVRVRVADVSLDGGFALMSLAQRTGIWRSHGVCTRDLSRKVNGDMIGRCVV